MSKSSSLARQVKGYLPPKYYNLITAYTDVNEMGKSEAVKVIVKDFFDRMPEEEKERLLEKRQSKNSY